MKALPIGMAVTLAAGTGIVLKNKQMPGTMYAGSMLLAGGAGYFLGKTVDKLIAGSPQLENVNLAKTEKDQILKNNLHLPAEQRVTPTHTKQEYTNYANALERAMRGGGTDDEAVVKTITDAIMNDLDYLLLVEAFALRDDDDLSTWLDDDGVRNKANAVLATKSSVSKRF